ncbi:hypothetical protein E2562_029948 [Oryza meyeriana var. granulata]|uniref:Uncharacterized protein n=1 Tax=Oryza meyeriana var. granulata TaxID=110450 RepID=A0A6G1CVC9_9ORYZ|nr:hypothetical protein E2562_029948 [Oryza meyeriana var. granulata]
MYIWNSSNARRKKGTEPAGNGRGGDLEQWVANKLESEPSILTKFTKQAAMASVNKLDMLLRRMAESELRRVEADQRTRGDLLSLKAAVEQWIPEVQKNVEDLQFSAGNVQSKVTPTKCSMICSSPNAVPDLTMAALDTCATTSMASVELVDGEDMTHVPYIDPTDLPKVMHARCSMVVLNITDDIVQACGSYSCSCPGGRRSAHGATISHFFEAKQHSQLGKEDAH